MPHQATYNPTGPARGIISQPHVVPKQVPAAGVSLRSAWGQPEISVPHYGTSKKQTLCVHDSRWPHKRTWPQTRCTDSMVQAVSFL